MTLCIYTYVYRKSKECYKHVFIHIDNKCYLQIFKNTNLQQNKGKRQHKLSYLISKLSRSRIMENCRFLCSKIYSKYIEQAYVCYVILISIFYGNLKKNCAIFTQNNSIQLFCAIVTNYKFNCLHEY